MNLQQKAYDIILEYVRSLYFVAKHMKCFTKKIDSNTNIKVCELKELFFCELMKTSFHRSDPIEIIISSKNPKESIENQIAKCVPIKQIEVPGIYIRVKINPELFSSKNKEDMYGNMVIMFQQPNGKCVKLTIKKPRNKGEIWNSVFSDQIDYDGIFTSADKYLNDRIANKIVMSLLNHLKVQRMNNAVLSIDVDNTDKETEEIIAKLASQYDTQKTQPKVVYEGNEIL